MRDSVAAGKYAMALFAEGKAKDQLKACQQGLTEMLRLLRTQGKLTDILTHPFIGLPEKEQLIRTALGEFASPLLERFLILLVEKHRFGLLSLITEEFQAAVDELQKVEPVHVRTAMPMSEVTQKQLKAALERRLGSVVRMDVQVDPTLIGGLVVQTADYVLDESLKGQLGLLARQLTS